MLIEFGDIPLSSFSTKLVEQYQTKRLNEDKKSRKKNNDEKPQSEKPKEDSCAAHLKPLVVTALNAGMRRGEVFNLTWDRVDLKHGFILLDLTKKELSSCRQKLKKVINIILAKGPLKDSERET